jgi:molybdopterin-guanine dinucleotide biosynthesis protein
MSFYSFGNFKVFSDRSYEETLHVFYKERFVNNLQFDAQAFFGIFDVLVDRVHKIDTVLDKIDSTTDLVNSILPDVLSVINYLKEVSANKTQIKLDLGLDVLSLIVGLNNINTDSNYLLLLSNLILLVVGFVKFLKNILLLYTDIPDLAEDDIFMDAQSLSGLEAIVGVSLIECLIPKHFRWIFSTMPLYTKTKVLDEPNFLHELFAWLIEIPLKVSAKLGLPQQLLDVIKGITDQIPFSKAKYFSSRMSSLIDQHIKQYNIINNEEFQLQVEKLNNEYIDWINHSSLNFSGVPHTLTSIYNKFRDLCNKVAHHKALVRQEPYFMVFYGPKGTGKTTFMMELVESLKINNSVYVHSSPSVEKDFYDMYESEDVMVIDDIGQKGIFQWANIINFVSTTQCPLDCAAVDKKDVKRMTSKVILATTNNINLVLTRSDPIQDIEALYRRCNVVDFSQVTFVDGVYLGKIKLLKRNPRRPEWDTLDTLDFSNSMVLNDIANIIVKGVQDRKDYKNNIGKKTIYIPKLSSQSFDTSSIVMTTILTFIVGLWAKTLYSKFSLRKEEENKSNSSIKKKYYQSVKVEKKNIRDFLPQYQKDLFIDKKEGTPVVKRMSSNVCVCRILDTDNNSLPVISTCIVSGNIITSVRHCLKLPVVGKKYWLKVYDGPTSLVYDSIKCDIVYISDIDDVIFFKIDDVVPKVFKSVPVVKQGYNTDLYLLPPQASFKIDSLVELDCRRSYKKYNYSNYIEVTDVAYFFQGDGFCGSPLVNGEGMILGHHIAGDKEAGVGTSKIWSNTTLEYFHSCVSNIVHFDIVTKSDGNFVKVVIPDKGTLVKKNSIVKSPIYGVFPDERQPANLQVFGNETTFKQASKAFEDTSFVNQDSFSWATNMMFDLIPSYEIQNRKQLFQGRRYNNFIDVSGSAGHGFRGNKSEHLFKDSLTFSQELIDRLEKVVLDANNYWYDFQDISEDKLKVELRDREKVNNPRVFTAAPVSLYVLDKVFFGNLVESIHDDFSSLGAQNKYLTGVMVGLNPFSSDWENMYNYLTEVGNQGFDGDVSKWDKKMLPQFQRTLNDIISSKCVSKKTNDIFPNLTESGMKFLIRQCLETLPSSIRLIGNESFLTTHSLPSGRFLTADYNSLMNKFYNLYIYCELFKEKYDMMPTFQDYSRDIRIAVYGDDHIIGCRKEVLLWFNAFSYREQMLKMGMDYTPADKGNWIVPYKNLLDTQFLKRRFAFHSILGRMVAPLDKTTMLSTLNYVSDQFRSDELIKEKLWNFQREAFLHSDYEALIIYLKNYLKDKNLGSFSFLSERELCDIYNRGDYGNTIVFS